MTLKDTIAAPGWLAMFAANDLESTYVTALVCWAVIDSDEEEGFIIIRGVVTVEDGTDMQLAEETDEFITYINTADGWLPDEKFELQWLRDERDREAQVDKEGE